MKTTKKAIILILISSLCAGIGQLMWKRASFTLNLDILSLLNAYLIGGILLYILGTVFMVVAFREGELSVLHPFLATSFIWVTLISPLFFVTETITASKTIAVILIFIGVYFISLGGKKANAS